MQLTSKNKGRIGATLCLVTANLFSITGPKAQEVQNAFDQPTDGPGTAVVDASVLYYRENNSRVQAVEPILSYTNNSENGDIFTARLITDSLSGASPFGATPWKAEQKFLSPVSTKAEREDEGRENGEGGEGQSSTGASGGTVVIDPVTGMRVLQSTAKANELPLNTGFQDTRVAVSLGYTTSLASKTKLSLNISGSSERDYQTFSGGGSIAQSFNNNTTTISVGGSYEYDKSKRQYGTPTPFALMTGVFTDGSQIEHIASFSAGITQVVTRNWLVQLNYSYIRATGYQNNPYKVISIVDSFTGGPQKYLYESRPRERTRQAVYVGSKLAVGSLVTNLSGRYYHDNWGINSYTANLSEHIPIGYRAYIEPGVRYYHQSSADFFNYFLLSNAVLPQFASSDYRLDGFNAITVSLQGGYMFTDRLEIYVMGNYYHQTKSGTRGFLPGDNRNLDLFAGIDAVNFMTGVKYKF